MFDFPAFTSASNKRDDEFFDQIARRGAPSNDNVNFSSENEWHCDWPPKKDLRNFELLNEKEIKKEFVNSDFISKTKIKFKG